MSSSLDPFSNDDEDGGNVDDADEYVVIIDDDDATLFGVVNCPRRVSGWSWRCLSSVAVCPFGS